MSMDLLFNKLCLEQTLMNAWKQIKKKNSAGGIDGVSLSDFEEKLHANIESLVSDLSNRKWKPQPYLMIEIPKKNKEETRKLGMLSIRDKIVQHAIKSLVEPRMERLFLNNSYAYRPGRGTTKAVKRAFAECKRKDISAVVKLDIDDFFDNVNHDILCARLQSITCSSEIVRLMMLIVKMGKVDESGQWIETNKGIPQGAVLSPLMANLYLHSFDQFVTSKCNSYIRYSDDFVIMAQNVDECVRLTGKVTKYLKEKLCLGLNEAQYMNTTDGFDFLGVHVSEKEITITTEKRQELLQRIKELEINNCGFSRKSQKTWDGIANYYGQLLPQSDLELFDAALFGRIKEIIEKEKGVFTNKTILKNILSQIMFLAKTNNEKRKQLIQELVDYFVQKNMSVTVSNDKYTNDKIIKQRKLEYRRRQAECSELIVTKPGIFIGLTNRGITIKEKGVLTGTYRPVTISHIVITTNGVALSSNLIRYCVSNKIPIDFFDFPDVYYGSFFSPKFMESTIWQQQAIASQKQRCELAMYILGGKIRNQLNLVKYYHKYHKHLPNRLADRFEEIKAYVDNFIEFKKTCDYSDTHTTMQKLLTYESQTAVKYWAYIKELLADDKILFEKRIRKGATDIVNCMLNYGYALLYSRVWYAILEAKLNPYDSVIHIPHSGNPTLVFDVIEIFRAQAVDRVVISLIQKGTDLEMRNGKLSDYTKKELTKNISERLNRHETFRKQEMTLKNIISSQCMDIADFYKTGKTFKPYIAKW